MNKQHILIFSLTAIFLCSCTKEKTFKSNVEDYNVYLETNAPNTASKYFDTWNNKITKDSTELMSFGIVAGEYERNFGKTGNITYLKKAEKALTKAFEIANIGKENYARGLARNYISQHRFREALKMAEIADSIGGGKEETQALLFDVHLELGNYQTAASYLDSLKNMSSFGYLIRAAKWNDYKGDLDTTIKLMEQAMARAESSNNISLRLWSYTNIADYYGHAGRIEDSYRYYLKALKLDPKNAYAKKGLAWIVFSHEKNGVEALRILDAVTQNYVAPDYYLLKAEIYDFLGDEDKKAQNLDAYFNLAKNPYYGQMYAAYNVEFLLEHTKDYQKAMQLAFKEIESRPTPETYNLLAKTYLKMGEYKKALAVVEDKLVAKSYEPTILWTTAEVYKANNEFDKVQALKRELETAFYELGPNAIEPIKNL
ncbi:tetratricopeptide repeat protein [Croceivirga radicis]|uniref:tetratricopeptide repeat protein n=1 Tax=Croceivirga radicis TaxID=1929488 RepID=UPI000255AC62|nr:tetratricopeptide repeat protein [Croceivirga radicis]